MDLSQREHSLSLHVRALKSSAIATFLYGIALNKSIWYVCLAAPHTGSLLMVTQKNVLLTTPCEVSVSLYEKEGGWLAM